MKLELQKLINHQSLTEQEAFNAMLKIGSGEENETQIAAFVSAYLMRPITVSELEGFRQALLELGVKVNLEVDNCIDVCGTGGDGKDTFNISTLSAIVCAGAGLKVAKHGNYSVSSKCGSSDVLEYLGVKFTNDESKLNKQIEGSNICFMHAPMFHSALRHVSGVRKSLGIKTFFNMLGPMVNPSKPNKQLVGVFSLDLMRLYHYLYQDADLDYCIIHALDGYDEISLTSPVKYASYKGEGLVSEKDFGVRKIDASEIYGGKGVEDSAEIFKKVLANEGTESQNNVVCANAAMAISTYYKEINPSDAFIIAKDSLKSGKANKAFKKLLELQ